MDARFSPRASAPDAGTMDYYFRIYQSLFSQPPEVSQAKMLDSKDSSLFEPEPLLKHCFQQFKRKDFHLPESRRRIIVLPQKQAQVPKDPTLPPPPPPPPVPSYKALENGDTQEQPEDTRTWLNRRLKLRKQLESFGDVRTWLENKPSLTPSEAKVLHMIHEELEARSDRASPVLRDIRRKTLQASQKLVPQLRLPKPSALSDLFSYLHRRKLKVLDLFHKTDLNGKQRISREEFILTLKAVGVPLSNLEMEDVVIYLDSLGKQNTITMENLANAYKQWSLAQQRSTLYTGRGGYNLKKEKGSLKGSRCKQKDSLSHTPKMDLLMVPKVDIDTEGWPMTLGEKKEVGKHYERKRPHKHTLPSGQYSVRSGRGQFAGHCLWSTIPGEMEALFNKAHKDALQVYLQCWQLCESYGLPLTEDILMRALLYPGDKIIFQKDYVHPIRQPGGFYSDWKITPKLAQFRGHKESGATRKTFKTKKMRFMDFERFTRKLMKKSPGASLRTHPNSFWPGHLLDKLRLYLPTVARDSSLALFSCVRHEHHVYPAIYHPHRWWPLRDTSYMTCAHYDSTKVYYLN